MPSLAAHAMAVATATPVSWAAWETDCPDRTFSMREARSGALGSAASCPTSSIFRASVAMSSPLSFSRSWYAVQKCFQEPNSKMTRGRWFSGCRLNRGLVGWLILRSRRDKLVKVSLADSQGQKFEMELASKTPERACSNRLRSTLEEIACTKSCSTNLALYSLLNLSWAKVKEIGSLHNANAPSARRLIRVIKVVNSQIKS